MGRPRSDPPRPIGRPKTGRPRARILFAVKGWPEWGGWVERLRAHSGHASVAALVEAALLDYGRRIEFREPSPGRWWMSDRTPKKGDQP